jgi:hypothetical protein
MISSSDILHGKVLIVDNQEVSVLLLERLLRGHELVPLMDFQIRESDQNAKLREYRAGSVAAGQSRQQVRVLPEFAD